MSATKQRHEQWVCVDCLFALHFGIDGVENPDPRWNRDEVLKSVKSGEWTDWHCVCHEYDESWCEHCDSDDDGTMVFSYRQCDCCKSTLGGSRHRFSWHA